MLKDYFGKPIKNLSDKKLFLLDMDGTIYNEDLLFAGVLEFLEYINSINGKYVFITNNSSKSVNDYVAKVVRMGIKADSENFFTSTQATALLLEKDYGQKKIYCQGTRSLIKEFRDRGFCVTETVEPDIAVIVVGFDTELTSQKLRNTCELLLRDIPFIATNPDLVCPVSFGYVPDCGSICMMLENATGRKPTYIGKPEPTMIEIAMDKFGFSREETLVIGDRLYTDIASGMNAGVDTVCVLSGEAKVADLVGSVYKPTYVLENIKDLYFALNGNLF